MGTKNNPGKFDCYTNAAPDEPMFILLGRDKHAATLVRLWALLRAREGENEEKVAEALTCAAAMDAWQHSLGRAPYADRPDLCERLLITATEGMNCHPDDYADSCDCNECR